MRGPHSVPGCPTIVQTLDRPRRRYPAEDGLPEKTWGGLLAVDESAHACSFAIDTHKDGGASKRLVEETATYDI